MPVVAKRPRWVTGFVIAGIVLVALFLVVHLVEGAVTGSMGMH
jgi:hypothetical protein